MAEHTARAPKPRGGGAWGTGAAPEGPEDPGPPPCRSEAIGAARPRRGGTRSRDSGTAFPLRSRGPGREPRANRAKRGRQEGGGAAATFYLIIGHYSVRKGGLLLGPYIEKPGAVRRRASYLIGHNARVKTYPDGSQEVLVCEAPIFGFDGWEDPRKPSKARRAKEGGGDPDRAIRRAKAQVKDLALCTPFRWFVTLTLSPEKVRDRHDPVEVVRRLNHWLDNQVRRKGLAYVLVPERHQDGAIHFHGFFNDALLATDSGTMVPPGGGKPRRPRGAAQRAHWVAQGGRVVYNLPGWGWGFSTAMELYGEYSKAVGYVCKYIGKDVSAGKIGGRWYYSGGALGRPRVDYADLSLESTAAEPGSYRFTVRDAGLGFVMARYERGCGDEVQGAENSVGSCEAAGGVSLFRGMSGGSAAELCALSLQSDNAGGTDRGGERGGPVQPGRVALIPGARS